MSFRFPHRTLALLLVAAIGAAGSEARAQSSCSGGTSCTIGINMQAATNYVARLTLASNTTTLTAPTAAAFGSAAGVNNAAANTLTVYSNAAYTVTAAAAAPNFTGGSGSKPASSVRYTTDNFANLKSVAGTGTQLAAGAVATGGLAYIIGYNTTYSWTQDTPGTYTLAIRYTLTAP